ncbi:MAG: glycosyltransferase family 2 protein [Candidatus Bathyarchaeota archaeon]|nr:glycosyltransferase family 2 protein [Candidatus Bathyarchaeota archaeon]
MLLKTQVIEQLFSTQLIVAALNEEQGIGPTLTDFIDNLGVMKVLVIDGNSKDRTAEIAKNLGADVTFQDGVGKGNAIAKALEEIKPNIKYVILTDADYTYPAKYVPQMIEILEKNPNVGMVCGNRFNGNVESDAVQRSFYFGNKILSLVHTLINGVSLDDPLTGLRVIRTAVLKNWIAKSQGFDIEVELNHQIRKRGYKIKEVPIGYRKRLGEKKLKIKDGLIILRRILSEITH